VLCFAETLSAHLRTRGVNNSAVRITASNNRRNESTIAFGFMIVRRAAPGLHDVVTSWFECSVRIHISVFGSDFRMRAASAVQASGMLTSPYPDVRALCAVPPKPPLPARFAFGQRLPARVRSFSNCLQSRRKFVVVSYTYAGSYSPRLRNDNDCWRRSSHTIFRCISQCHFFANCKPLQFNHDRNYTSGQESSIVPASRPTHN